MIKTKYLIARKERNQSETYYNYLILDWVFDPCIGTLFDSRGKAEDSRMKDHVYSITYLVKLTISIEKAK
jgi:hypothetical protein